MPRSKPFKYTYEKEIVMYAHFKKLDYFSTECTYAPNAYRGFAREFLKDAEVRVGGGGGGGLPGPGVGGCARAFCVAGGSGFFMCVCTFSERTHSPTRKGPSLTH